MVVLKAAGNLSYTQKRLLRNESSLFCVILSLIQSQEQRMVGRNLAFVILPLGVTHVA